MWFSYAMTPIFLEIDGSQAGPFSPEQVREKLAKGEITDSTLAWKEGMGGWEPVAQALKAAPPALPPQQPPTGQPVPVSQPKTSGLAIASLILGCLGFVLAGITGLPAIICGHIARSKIRNSNGTQTGSGIALAGLITGYFGFVILAIAILAALAVPTFNVIQDKAKIMKVMNQGRQIHMACQLYQSDNDSYPDSLDQLVPDYLPDASILKDSFDPSGTAAAFEYLKPDPDAPASTLVLKSLWTSKAGHYVVVYKDGSTSQFDPDNPERFPHGTGQAE